MGQRHFDQPDAGVATLVEPGQIAVSFSTRSCSGQIPKCAATPSFIANYVGRRISDVGTFGLADIYQQGNTFIDFVYRYTFDEKGKWNLRFEAENLANNEYRWMQGDILQRSYRSGP